MSELFDEVDEEVRREQLKKLWDKYSIYIIGAALLIIAAVGAWRGYQYLEAKKAAEAGDPHAVETWRRYTDDLARGLANIIAFVNPEIIALGGGVSSAGAFMLDAVRPKVEELTTMVPRGGTRVVTATLGNDAGAIGASVMARRGGLTTRDAA